jgi:ABC-type sugar transport system ATPase subunit
MDFPIALNTTLASLGKVSSRGFLAFEEERRFAGEYFERFRVKAPSVETPVRNLSGGNQQKVSLARWLMTEPQVLILDEPTQGIDVGAKAEIYALINELAGRGLAILLISSELPEILGLSDRIAVMHQGRIAGVLSRDEANAQRVMELALGHGAAA